MAGQNGPLMGSQHPAFQQGRHSIAPGQQVVSDNGFLADHAMNIPSLRHRRIGLPTVRQDRAARQYGSFYRVAKRCGRSVCNALQTDPPNPGAQSLCRNDDQRLTFRSPPPLSAGFSANIDLVEFNTSSKTVPPRSDHGPAQLVQPVPSGVIAPKTQLTLNA